MLNQIEFNPYCCDEDILKACEEHGIVVQAYSPVGSGSRVGTQGETKLGGDQRVNSAQSIYLLTSIRTNI